MRPSVSLLQNSSQDDTVSSNFKPIFCLRHIAIAGKNIKKEIRKTHTEHSSELLTHLLNQCVNYLVSFPVPTKDKYALVTSCALIPWELLSKALSLQ